MKDTFQKVILMILAIFLVISSVNQVFAEDEQEVPQPRIDDSDKDDNVRPGWNDPTQNRPDRELSWDEIRNESSAPSEGGPNNGEDNSTSSKDDQDTSGPNVDERDDSTEESDQKNSDPIDSDEMENESSEPEQDEENNEKDSSMWDIVDNVTGIGGSVFSILGADGENGSTARNLDILSGLIGIPLTIYNPMMTDGQKALADLSEYSLDVTGTGIEWSRASIDPEKTSRFTPVLNQMSKIKDALHATSNFINTAMSKGSGMLSNVLSSGKDKLRSSSAFSNVMSKGKEMFSKGSSVFSSVISKGKDMVSKGGSVLSSAVSKGKDLVSRGSGLLNNALSKGKDMLSKGSSVLNSVISKGKDTVSKGSNIFSSAVSKGKDLVSKGSSLLNNALSKGKGMLSKGSSLLSNVMTKGKDIVSKGSSLLSSAVSKGKDVVSKGGSLLSSAVSKGKDVVSKGSSLLSNAMSKGKGLISKGSDLLSKGKTAIANSKFGTVLSVTKTVVAKGAGVLSLVGAVSDGAKAIDYFKSGKTLDGAGKTLAVVGGLLTAAALLTPVGLTVGVVGLVATGASLIIEHRDAIKKGAKKVGKAVVDGAKAAKDTVVNGFKSIGKGLGSIFG